MNLIRFILLSLFIFTHVQDNTIYNLIKIPNLEIYEINETNKLRYLYAKQPFTIGVDKNINCFNSEKKVCENDDFSCDFIWTLLVTVAFIFWMSILISVNKKVKPRFTEPRFTGEPLFTGGKPNFLQN